MKEIKLKTDLTELIELLKDFEEHLATKTTEYQNVIGTNKFEGFVLSFLFDWLNKNKQGV